MAATRRFLIPQKILQKTLTTVGAFAFVHAMSDNIKSCPDNPWARTGIYTVGVSAAEDIIETAFHYTHVPNPRQIIKHALGSESKIKYAKQLARFVIKAAVACVPMTIWSVYDTEYKDKIPPPFWRDLLLALQTGVATMVAELVFDRKWSPAGLTYRLLEDIPDRDAVVANVPLYEDHSILAVQDSFGRDWYKLLKGASELNLNLVFLRLIFDDESVFTNKLVLISSLLLIFSRIRKCVEWLAYTPTEAESTRAAIEDFFYSMADFCRSCCCDTDNNPNDDDSDSDREGAYVPLPGETTGGNPPRAVQGAEQPPTAGTGQGAESTDTGIGTGLLTETLIIKTQGGDSSASDKTSVNLTEENRQNAEVNNNIHHKPPLKSPSENNKDHFNFFTKHTKHIIIDIHKNTKENNRRSISGYS